MNSTLVDQVRCETLRHSSILRALCLCADFNLLRCRTRLCIRRRFPCLFLCPRAMRGLLVVLQRACNQPKSAKRAFAREKPLFREIAGSIESSSGTFLAADSHRGGSAWLSPRRFATAGADIRRESQPFKQTFTHRRSACKLTFAQVLASTDDVRFGLSPFLVMSLDVTHKLHFSLLWWHL